MNDLTALLATAVGSGYRRCRAVSSHLVNAATFGGTTCSVRIGEGDHVYGVERPRLTLGVGSRARVRSLRGSPSARAVLGLPGMRVRSVSIAREGTAVAGSCV